MKRNDPIEAAKRRPTSLRAAVNAKCWDCIGRDADPRPTQRIRECEARACPLYPVRPFQRGAQRGSELPDVASESEP